jgi:MFS family permease
LEVNYVSFSTKSDSRWAALALIVTAQFMVILDVAIVNVALPSIQSDLDFSQTNLQWVISAYAILFGGVLLLGGRLADLLGRRRLFVAGLAVRGLADRVSRAARARRRLARPGRARAPDDDLRGGPGA